MSVHFSIIQSRGG